MQRQGKLTKVTKNNKDSKQRGVFDNKRDHAWGK